MATRPVHIESLIHYHVNDARHERGLRSLNYDSNLVTIARQHSTDMAERGFFSHTTPEGNDIGDRYRTNRYHIEYPNRNQWGENIARRSLAISKVDQQPEIERSRILVETAQNVVEQWLDSPGHRKNLLNENWKREGIGVNIREKTSPEELFVTQNFS